MKIIILLIVVFMGGAYFYVESQKVDFSSDVVSQPEIVSSESANEGETDFIPSDTTNGMSVGENTIVTQEQRPGKTVNVAQVYLATPGYIVIYADTDGKATTVLGSSALLPAGESSTVSVTLSKATSEGESVWAFVHSESNGDSKFDSAVDIKVMDVLGESISSMIEIKANAEAGTAVSI